MSKYYLKLNLSSGQRVQWPDKCAFCGAKAVAKAETSFSKVTGAGYYVVAFGWSTQSKSFLYPVCRKHKSLCSLLGVPSKWTAVNTLLYLIIVPSFGILPACFLMLFYEMMGITATAGFWHILLGLVLSFPLLLFILMILWKILSVGYNPIRITDATENSISLCVPNKVFVQEFKWLNADIIENS